MSALFRLVPVVSCVHIDLEFDSQMCCPGHLLFQDLFCLFELVFRHFQQQLIVYLKIGAFIATRSPNDRCIKLLDFSSGIGRLRPNIVTE